MSGFIINRTANRVEIVADGATYDQKTGAIRRLDVLKIQVSPLLPLAIVTRGQAQDVCAKVAELVLQIAADTRTFDRTIAVVGDLLRSSIAALAKLPEVQFVIAGFSEATGATSVIGQTYPGLMDGTPWQIGDLRRLAPVFPAGVAPIFQGELPMLDQCAPDLLERHGVAAMEVMRRKPMSAADAGGNFDVYLIGGHVQYVALSRDAPVVDRILHRWPDEAGKPIQPHHAAD